MELTDKALRMSRVGMNHEHRHKWPVEKRIEVVTKVLALGNMRLVSELTGVSYQLIREWKQEPWWNQIVDEIRASRNSALDTKLSRLVDKSLETVADRLDNGNLFMDKKGELQRKPLTALEANKIATDMLNQETLVQKRVVAQTEGQNVQSMADMIAGLAREFARFNTNRTVDVVAKTIHEPSEEIVNAVYEEREEGLQDPVREVRWATGPDQGEGGAESSPSNRGEEGERAQGGWEGRGPHQASEQGWENDSGESSSSESSEQSFIRP